jgi:heme/copper-type cytochrome/quinol oxidase subunit 3
LAQKKHFAVFVLMFFTYKNVLAQKPNLEKKEKKYSSKFFNNFHLSESSFTCPGSGKWVSAKTAL